MDYLEKGQTITTREIQEKRRGMLAKGVLFLQDNAPAHKSHITMN
jgi:hypothetical protein